MDPQMIYDFDTVISREGTHSEKYDARKRFFGPAGEGWFRVNCAHPRAQLLAAVDRLGTVFST
jgi:bifunctional pyridoxal-dependent enzyme with beta-cystathionase and maltose regulon repressor activities